MSKHYYVTVVRKTATTYSVFADDIQEAIGEAKSPFSSASVLETLLGNEHIVCVEEVGHDEDF